MDAGTDELQATVADAYVYASPMLFNDKTLHEQAPMRRVDAGPSGG